MRGGALLRLDLSERTQAEAFLMRRYEPGVVTLVAGRLPPRGGVFFDVGAHVGLISFQVAALRRSRGVAIHAFEPNPASRLAFEHNLELNPDADVRLVPSAVGAAAGSATLTWPRARHDPAASRIEAGPVADGELESESVSVIALDDYAAEAGIERVDVLKLDVEGHELPALEGAERLLSSGRVGCLVCEFNRVYLREAGLSGAELTGRLRGWGFEPVEVPRVGAQRFRRPAPDPDVSEQAFVRGGA